MVCCRLRCEVGEAAGIPERPGVSEAEGERRMERAKTRIMIRREKEPSRVLAVEAAGAGRVERSEGSASVAVAGRQKRVVRKKALVTAGAGTATDTTVATTAGEAGGAVAEDLSAEAGGPGRAALRGNVERSGGGAGRAVMRDGREFFPPQPGRPAERPSPVQTALELLAGGHSDLVAVRQLREGHNLSLEQAQAAVEAAYEKMTASRGRGLAQKMALAVEQRCRIAAAALDQSDYRIALSALEQRDKLLGLTGPEALTGGEAASTLLQLLQQAAGGINQTGATLPAVEAGPESES